VTLAPILLATALASPPPEPALIPKPQQATWREGSFTIDRQTSVVAIGAASGVGEAVRTELGRVTGFPLPLKARSGSNALRFVIRPRNGADPEGYRLEVDRSGVTVTASAPAGLFYGYQTLRQLLPDAASGTKRAQARWTLPFGSVQDEPRFGWRGLHLDVSRHFFPTAYIKKWLDWMAAHKLNVFHWHLIDDGGWRMEVPKYPRLTSVGAWRYDTGGQWPGGEWNYGNLRFCMEPGDGPRYGGYYTVAEIKEIVKYAAERHITVVPEIEMPGHNLPAIVAYPELGCDNVPPAPLPGKSETNVFCAGKEGTMQFLRDVLDETMELFPSKFIHIGADEVWKEHWKNCPKCQERRRAEGLKNEDELQSWFVRQFDAYLGSKGRRLVGWDEILEGGLAPGATVMSWRGVSGGIAAAKAGRDVVMSPTSHCYFDYSYATIPTSLVYAFEPVPAELSEDEGQRVLGAQGNVWTEWIATEARAEEMTYPRIVALAEVLWLDKEKKDWDGFSRRLTRHLGRLDAMGVRYRLDAPEAEFDAVLQGSTEPIAFSAPSVAGTVVRYTTDGTEPTPKSPVLKGRLRADRPGVVTAATFRGEARSEPVRVAVLPRPGRLGRALQPGLRLFTAVGRFGKLSEAEARFMFAGTASTVDLAGFDGRDDFALSFEGYLTIKTAGVYTLWLGSDDGCRLWLSGALAIDNDGLHGRVVKRLRARLEPGVYPLRAAMFEAGGAESLTLEIEGPGLARRPLPAAMLGH
jgi:hexosaminidase